MAITITVCVSGDGPAQMQAELEGDFDADAARRLLEAVQACQGIHHLGLDFRQVRRMDAASLLELVEALAAPGMPAVRARGLPPSESGMLRGLGYDPVGLRSAATGWTTVVGQA
jgi:hypothetical protein